MDPLGESISRGDVSQVQEILNETGVEIINKKNYNGVTPLAIAVANEDHAMIQLLLKNGADLYQVSREVMPLNEREYLPIAFAARMGNEEIVELLLEKMDPTLVTQDQLSEVLRKASYYNDEIVSGRISNMIIEWRGR